MKKEIYEAPIMETVVFESEDIITTSTKVAILQGQNELEDIEW